MKAGSRKWLSGRSMWFLGFALFLCMAETAFGQSSNPSKIMDQYRSQRIQWTTNIWPYANTLFGLLAVIEFSWSAAVMLLEKTDLQSWTAALIRKIMWIGAFYALLLNGRLWIPWIIESFEQIGEGASGVAALSPSAVFSQGLNIAGALMDSSSTSAFFTKPGSSLALVFAALIIVLSYGIITLQFIVAMVESYIIVAAGFIFVGFGGSRWTVPYTERYIGLAVSTGVKIMLLYLLIGAGFNFAVDWQVAATTVATSPSPMMSAFDIMGASVIFMMLCWQIPKLFSAVLGGAPALTGGDLLSTTTGLVAGAAAVGSVAAGGVGVAAGGAAALSGVGSAAGAGSSSSGATSVMSVGSASSIAGSSGASGGGGSVPPPSNPPAGPSSNGSNGGPKQPDPPPFNRGGGSASEGVGVGVSSSNGTSGSRNGSGGSHNASESPNGSGGAASIRSALGSVGGDSLAGSGFEGERPAAGFAPASVTTRTGSAVDVPPPPVSRSASSYSAPAPQLASGPEVVASQPSSMDAGGPAGNGIVSDFGSVSSHAAVDNAQAPAPNRRERIGATARKADHMLSGASNRLRGIRNQLGGLPSDAAPHSPPPRMPVDDLD